MIGTKRFLADRQRALVQWLGVSVAVQLVVEHSQVVQRNRNVRMIGTKRLLLDRQRALIQRLGVRIVGH